MVRIEIQLDEASPGWATILLSTAGRTITIPCSHVGGDCLSEIVRAFVLLAEGDERVSAEVDCYGEPESTLIRLKRSGPDIEVSVTRFSWEGDHASEAKIQRALKTMKPKDWSKMQQSRSKPANLRQSAPLIETVASVIRAFHSIEDQFGADGYRSIWGFEFPSVELAKLKMYQSVSLD